MATELAGIRRALRNSDRCGVSLGVTGVGKSATVSGLSKIVASGPEAVIMVGFCGASDPGLHTGDLHVAGVYLQASATDGEAIAADTALSSQLIVAARRSGTGISHEPSATVDVIAGPRLKSELRVSAGVASVNMEDYWAASAARSVEVPFASVRAVLDMAADALPDYLSSDGSNTIRLARGLATHPGRASTLFRLARQARIARRSLTRCVLAWLEAWKTHKTSLTTVSP